MSFEAYQIKKGLGTYIAMRNAKHVDHFLRWIKSDAAQTTYPDLINYLEHLRKAHPTPSTLQKKTTALKHYFDYLIAEKHMDRNPARHLNIRTSQDRKRYHLLTKEQLEQLYHHYRTTPKPQWTTTSKLTALRRKLTLGLMVWQALEVTTLSKLSIKDVHLDKGIIKVIGGRKFKARTLTLQSAQIMELYQYVETIHPQLVAEMNPIDPNLLLVFGGKDYYDAHRVLVKDLKEQHPFLTSISGGIPKQIRASVITLWLKQYNLREVQYMAGYRHVRSVEAYLQSDIESLQADIDRFFPLG
ncbi:MAG: tyrosine-type recombinase/integrase [Verrucomicrobiota bacterium]